MRSLLRSGLLALALTMGVSGCTAAFGAYAPGRPAYIQATVGAPVYGYPYGYGYGYGYGSAAYGYPYAVYPGATYMYSSAPYYYYGGYGANVRFPAARPGIGMYFDRRPPGRR